MYGYKEADKIDKQLADLLEEHPITKVNCMDWMKFTRTVESTLIIIREAAEVVAYGLK